ncbi:hypothetical protein A191_04050, partial [Escherichia coli KTE233]
MSVKLTHIVNVVCPVKRFYDNNAQGKITKARSPQGLTPGSFCPWLLFASYVLTLP